MACEFKKYNYDTMNLCSHVPHKLSLLTSTGDIHESFQEMKYFTNSEERCSKKFSLSSKNESLPPTSPSFTTVNIPGYVIFNGKIERSLRSSVRKKSLTKIPDNVANEESSVDKKIKKSVTFSKSHYIRFIDNRFTILSENDVNELWYNAVDFMNIRISAELEAHYFKLENPKIINDKFFLKRLWSGTNYDEYKNNIIINSITTFCSKTQRITKTPP
jgi:hypothetical protein